MTQGSKTLGPCDVCGHDVIAEDVLACRRVERTPVYGRIGDPGYGHGRPSGYTERTSWTCGTCALAAAHAARVLP